MKVNIHPKFFEDVVVTCRSCGATFTTGSTNPNIVMEVCNKCHPFYTGEQRFVDTKGRVEKFAKRMEDAKKYADLRKNKKDKKSGSAGKESKSLRELLGEV
ncbi:MAG: 50S ribosomal protein L31 [Patescibacteria group bacterium]|nr:50S ribosomal protein L31 [Patescibacteria group bacterium]